MEEFIASTIDPNIFTIQDVADDNACFYRAIANIFNYYTPHDKLNKIKVLDRYGSLKNLENTVNDARWGYCSENQDRLSRFLQGKSYRWVKRNYSKQLPEYDMDIGTMILLTHEIDIEEYLDRYKYFAGDNIVEEVDTGKVYKSGRRKGEKVIKNVSLEDRWGGTPEQIALSEAYKIPIVIITSQKYDKRRKKIITGKIRNDKPEKGVRFKLMQVIGKKYLKDKLPIFVLWKKHRQLGHYFSLYPKSVEKIKEFVSNYLV